MNEWARLVDRYANELRRYELVCAFCGQYLSNETVNTCCADNIHPKPNESHEDGGQRGVYFTEDEPDPDVFGKRKHWFGRPVMRGQRQDTPVGGW